MTVIPSRMAYRPEREAKIVWKLDDDAHRRLAIEVEPGLTASVTAPPAHLDRTAGVIGRRQLETTAVLAAPPLPSRRAAKVA